nr:tRNA pseudouridine(38-40) synthase TruA [uncultured Prevotella sp.]
MRYFITFAYDGTNYHGWQIQPNGISVQERLNESLSTLLRKAVETVGAGRTDAGVHARMMVAHFDWPDELDCGRLLYRLNRILPWDISVSNIQLVPEELHARFSAKSRLYRYYIHLKKNPFLKRYSWEVHYPLDFSKMNAAAAMLLGEKDFACFCKAGGNQNNTFCHVTEAHWDQVGEQWVFTIRANRFLRNMVRAVVGTMVNVGRHLITLDDFEQILAKGSRSDAGESVPGNALFLEEIKY